MTLRIRPYSERWWSERSTPAHDPAVTDIENWPHRFAEHPDRWVMSGGDRLQREGYAGCRICGASELSAIHLEIAS